VNFEKPISTTQGPDVMGGGWGLKVGLPVAGVQGDGPRVLHLAGQKRGPHGAVQLGHLDLVQVALHPVDVAGDPVHRQALGGGQAVLDHHVEAGQS